MNRVMMGATEGSMNSGADEREILNLESTGLTRGGEESAAHEAVLGAMGAAGTDESRDKRAASGAEIDMGNMEIVRMPLWSLPLQQC